MPELLRTIGERLQASATVKNIYGDPVSAGDRTVIPIARIFYAFGGGGGESATHTDSAQTGGGGGGGGRMSAEPCGALEISSSGTRFIAFSNRKQRAGYIALGFALGLVVNSQMRGRRR